jgi:acetyltransferase-like isoleucine patch superfamily enzyme
MAWDESIKKELKYCGENVKIGPYCIFTNPSAVILHDHVRVDPLSLFTVAMNIGSYSHICSHAVLGGGAKHTIRLRGGNFIGYGSKLFCASEDYSGEFGVVGDYWFENKIFRGDITFEEYSGVASGTIVMPGIVLPKGCTIGAQSFVYKSHGLTEWSIWLGNPLRFHKLRIKSEAKVKEQWR